MTDTLPTPEEAAALATLPAADLPDCAIVELMGHRTLYGALDLVHVAGVPMLRVRMPAQHVPEGETLTHNRYVEDVDDERAVYGRHERYRCRRAAGELPAVERYANPRMLYALRPAQLSDLLVMRADAARMADGGPHQAMLPDEWTRLPLEDLGPVDQPLQITEADHAD